MNAHIKAGITTFLIVSIVGSIIYGMGEYPEQTGAILKWIFIVGFGSFVVLAIYSCCYAFFDEFLGEEDDYYP